MNAFSPASTPSLGVIFAVDDEESDRLLFQRRIAAAGLPYTCRLFASGDELLDALIDVLRGAPAPAACFVDVKMAGMSGLDVLRWIRAQRALDPIPVIMLSSSDDPLFLAEASHFGAQCYAAKFPSDAQLRDILTAAQTHADAASCATAFTLPCNLLLGARVPA